MTWRRASFWVPLVLGALAGLLAGIFWSTSTHSGYQGTGTAFVAFTFQAEETDPFSASLFVSQRIDSYAQLGQSPQVLQAVADKVGGRDAADLAGNVEVSAVPGTVLLRVTVHDSDRLTALKVTDSVMSELDHVLVEFESGSPDAPAPVGLVTIQPAIAGPASSPIVDVLKSGAGLAVGTLLGAALGWLLSLGKPSGAPPSQNVLGRHREKSAGESVRQSEAPSAKTPADPPVNLRTYSQ